MAYVFQEFGWHVHLFFDGSVDVGIAHGAFQLIGLGGTAEVGLQFQVDVEIGSYKVFLREYSVKA